MMNRDMRDYMDREYRGRDSRDGRNPYGSRGGYVSSSRPDSRDYARGGRDYAYDDEARMRYHGTYDSRSNDYDDERRNYDRDYRHEDYARNSRGRFTRDSRYYEDFGGGMLSKKELHKWQNKLCEHMDQQECEMFQYELIIQQAKQMNIQFDRYSEEEFYTTVLMMFTDYYKTCGANVPMYISLAKDFLEDKDSRVKYGEKLACYHDAFADV